MRSPWNGGGISLRCAQVLRAVEQQHGMRPSIGLRITGALARVQHVGGRAEHLADWSGWVRKIHLPSGGPRSTVKRLP